MFLFSRTNLLALSLMTILSPESNVFCMEEQNHCTQSNRWSATNTMITGALVGICDGLATRATDSIWPLNWILLCPVKDLVLKAIINDAYKSGEIIDTSLLKDSAWYVSWLTYLAAWSELRSHSIHRPRFLIIPI